MDRERDAADLGDLSREELDDLRAKALKASPGPWARDDIEIFDRDGTMIAEIMGVETTDRQDARNAAYVLAAQPQTVLRLLKMIGERGAGQASGDDGAT